MKNAKKKGAAAGAERRSVFRVGLAGVLGALVIFAAAGCGSHSSASAASAKGCDEIVAQFARDLRRPPNGADPTEVVDSYMLAIPFGVRVNGRTLTPCMTFADFRTAANRHRLAPLVSGMAQACKTQKPITFAIGSVPVGKSGAKDVTGADFAATPFCKSAPAS